MDLSNIPLVRVTPEMKQKYILVKVEVAEIESEQEGKYILYGDFGARRHYNIFRFLDQCGLVVTDNKGGGKIQIIDTTKSVYLWDFSREFGRVDAGMAMQLLEQSHPGYTVFLNTPPPGHDPEEDQ